MTSLLFVAPAPFTVPLDLRDPIWGTPAWPEKFTTLRPHQAAAIDQVLAHFDSGAQVVMVDAPTGSGKTILAEGVRRMLAPERTLYCPNTKGLQDQFCNDLDYAVLLKGRANYATADHPELFWSKFNNLSAADCIAKKEILPACSSCIYETPVAITHCRLCHPFTSCPYQQAKSAAMASQLAVLNTSYLIAECNSQRSSFSGADLIVIDEADTIGGTLMSQVEVFFSARKMKELDLQPPRLKTVPESWLAWVNEEAIPKIGAHLNAARLKVKGRGQPAVDDLRALSYLERTAHKLALLRTSLELGNAVYDGYDEGNIKFQPVHVAPFGPSMIWKHGERFLLMSATIIDAQQRAREWGIEEAGLRWELVKVPSTFPAERRPIHIRSAASMTFKEKETSWPKMASMVKKVLARHEGERVLIHTVSYEFTKFMFNELRFQDRPVFTYSDAKEREGVLRDFRANKGAVLLAPSMDRGVDLPNDECRAVILTKVPFPNMRDKRVNARLYSPGGQNWMTMEVVAKIVQMTGRGMRSEDDFVETYILDSQFTENIWSKGKNMFPVWWKEALDWSGAGL